MNAQKSLDAFTEAAADAIARAVANVQRDAQHERDLRDAEHRARLAELDVLTVSVRSLHRELSDRIASIKDGDQGPRGEPGQPGADVDMSFVRQMIGEALGVAVAELPPAPEGKQGQPGPQGDPGAPGEAGADADMEAVRSLIDEAVSAAVAALPPAEPGKDADPAVVREMISAAVAELPPAPAGKDADPEVIRQMVGEAVAQLPPAEKGERGEAGAPGLLPMVKAWDDRVYYAGAVVTSDGAMYQAERDTGRAPPHEDWRCIARAGRDGIDGRSFRICGTFVDGTEHVALDVVALNGAAFVAKRDDPGACPGEGWQMIAAQGKRGQAGERGIPGPKGDRGPAGPTIVSMETDADGVVTLKSADGSEVICDLYPVLSQLAR